MTQPVANLTKIRRALAELDRLVAEHPERVEQPGPRWSDNLTELDALTMSQTPPKDRIIAYRKRLKERGYTASTLYLNHGTKERLARLSETLNISYGEVVALALERFEAEDHRP